MTYLITKLGWKLSILGSALPSFFLRIFLWSFMGESHIIRHLLPYPSLKKTALSIHLPKPDVQYY